jgi:hypothetical protein
LLWFLCTTPEAMRKIKSFAECEQARKETHPFRTAKSRLG